MSIVRRFAMNLTGRDLIVGDIHGHFTKLERELQAIEFDPSKDRLFSVGDLVDRGPESELALDWIGKPWFHAVQGNHEDMAISWAKGILDSGLYVANGGGWNVGSPRAAQQDIAEAFKALPVAIELQTRGGLIGIVHADCPARPWQQFV
ncbi:MAG: metallophosphoesterase, partial [Reyranella sp.]|nr:metallophosphoesterase [Reyranella sp.]